MANRRGKKKAYRYEDVEKWAYKRGWYFARQKGSHRHYKHPTIKGTLTIPYRVSLNVMKRIEKMVGEKYDG